MLILKNGTVINPATGLHEKATVTAAGGVITGICPAVPETPKDVVIDAEGCYVVPGLIDHHAHLFPFAPTGIPAEAVCFSNGVTFVAEPGSLGTKNYESRRHFMPGLKLGVKFFLNVCSSGLDSLPVLEDVDPARYDREGIKRLFREYPGELLGLKIRTTAAIVKELGYGPLRETVKLADEIGVPVMVHCTNPPGEFSELLGYLRPGDVLTHMCMNQGSCLLQNGKVIEAAYEARKRGVLFEAADARYHFGMPVAAAAIREGFFPDILATDLTHLSMNLRPTSFGLCMQISKYATLGIPLDKLIACCTLAPAKQMGLEQEAGSLETGRRADITVLKPVHRKNLFGDRTFDREDLVTLEGDTLYKNVLTVKDGEMVYRDIEF